MFDVSLPITPLLSLLIAALPFAFRSVYIAVQRCLIEQDLKVVIAVGIFPLIWLLATHFAGLIFQRFDLALIVGTVPLALVGVATMRAGRSGARTASHNETLRRTTFDRPGVSIWGTIGCAAILLVPALLAFDFYDRYHYPSGHFAIAQQIVNGVYPPRDLLYANETMSYHYGVDTFAAMIMALFRVRVDVAFDFLTFCLWVVFLTLIPATLPAATRPRDKGIAILLVALGGSFPWWLESPATFTQVLLNHYNVLTPLKPDARFDSLVSPPTIAMLFQAPWTIGYLAFALTCMALARSKSMTEIGVASIIAISIAVMGIANTTLYLTMGGAVLGVATTLVVRPRVLHKNATRRLAVMILIGAVTGLVLGAAGGGLIPLILRSIGDPSFGQIELVLDAKLGDWPATINWNLACFGLLIPFAVFGFMRLHYPCAQKLYLGFLAAGSILVVNLFMYDRSWDIAKFATVAILALSFSAVPAVLALVNSRAWLLGAFIVVAIASPGLAFHSAFWLRKQDIPFGPGFWRAEIITTLGDEEKNAIAWLRRHIAKGEAVLCPKSIAEACVVLGGLPQMYTLPPGTPLHMAPWHYHLGAPIAPILKRRKLVRHPPEDVDKFIAAQMRWMLIRPTDQPWARLAENWRRKGEVEIRATFGQSRVYRLIAQSEVSRRAVPR